jgi:hypothetical protein
MPAFPRRASIVLLAVLAAPTVAPAADDADPLDVLKAVAKAKFEATQRTPAERARALAETAHAELRARFQEFMAGNITPDVFLSCSPRVLEAELALLDKDADPAPLYERHWRDMRELEFIAEVKFEAGKIDDAGVAEARFARLQAELDWLAHRDGGAKGPHGAAAADPFGEYRNMAREKREATQADPRQLTLEAREAAHDVLHARLQEFQAGKITPDFLLQATQWELSAELALLDRDADPTPLLERLWKTIGRIEERAEDKLRQGKLDAADLYQCRSIRLADEIAWLRAWKRAEKRGARITPAPVAADGEWVDDASWAKAKWEASDADIHTLLREWLDAARETYRDRRREFEGGIIMPDLVLQASLGILEAERAAASGPKDEAAAAERHWRRCLELEASAERKLAAGKIAVADVAEVRFTRLEAEIRMAFPPGEDK